MLIRLSENARLYHADCRDVLKTLPDNSIDSVVTDPPYALVSIQKRFGKPGSAPAKGNDAYMRASAGFMGKQWDTGETAFSEEFWREVLRVLKPGGHVAAFGASRGYHRMACAIEDAGFEIRDSLMWVYGTGFPKSQNVAKFIDKELGVDGTLGAPRSEHHARLLEAGTARRGEKHEGWDRPWMDDPEAIVAAQSTYIPGSPEAKRFDGFGTSLKPATEPICLARKPLSEKTVAVNVLRWGTGALNIGACRVETETRPLIAGRNGDDAGTDGYGSISGGSKHTGETTLGRWPANVVHSGEPSVVAAFPNSKGQQGDLNETGRARPTKTCFGDMAAPLPHKARNDSGSAARFFQACPYDEMDRRFHYSAKASRADRNGSKHPTVKPIALMQWLARLITPPGGTVLDPFAGSGTTGAAAEREGFSVVLCEREDEYVEDIKRRFDPNAAPVEVEKPLPARLLALLAWNANVEAYYDRRSKAAAHV